MGYSCLLVLYVFDFVAQVQLMGMADWKLFSDQLIATIVQVLSNIMLLLL